MTIGTFQVDKNILNKGASPFCNLQLNFLLLLVEVQCLLGLGRDLNTAVLVYAF
jgi:hypothetical protein